MKRGEYIRLSVHRIPDGLHAPSISVLQMVSDLSSILEGWLTEHVVAGSRLHLAARIQNGKPIEGIYTSTPILTIQGQYVRTNRLIYQILRVPPSRPEDSFKEFA
jgi:hypothetical protein